MIKKYACSNLNCKKEITLNLKKDNEARLTRGLGKETLYCVKCAKTLYGIFLFSNNKKYVTLSEIKQRQSTQKLENKNIIENYL
jgi:hypothetical protein